MASSNKESSVIHFDEQHEKSELQFQDFGHGDAATLETSDYSSSFPGSPDLENENAGLLEEEKKRTTFWEFSYYQSFFDVDTDQVIQRIIWSMLPVKGRSTFLDRIIRPTPDLYGPFWISTTLIFSIAISANIAQYFMTEGQDKRIWHYDFRKVSIAATAIYSYVFLLPLVLWGLMWYRRSSTRYTLLEILCVYGYSLFIYIPISILWLIQVAWLQWSLVIIGAGLSGLVLAHTFWPTVRDGNKKVAALALVLILVFHTALAVGFVTFFFRPPHHSKLHQPLLSTQNPVVEVTKEKLVSMNQKISSQEALGKSSPSADTKVVNGTKSESQKVENQMIKRKVTDIAATQTHSSSSPLSSSFNPNLNKSVNFAVSKNSTQEAKVLKSLLKEKLSNKTKLSTSVNVIVTTDHPGTSLGDAKKE